MEKQKREALEEALEEIFPSPHYGAPSKEFFDEIVIALVEAGYIPFESSHPSGLWDNFETAINQLEGEDSPRATVEYISIAGEAADDVPQIDIFLHGSQTLRVVYGANFIMKLEMEIEKGYDARFKWDGDGSVVSRLINVLEALDKTCEYFFRFTDPKDTE